MLRRVVVLLLFCSCVSCAQLNLPEGSRCTWNDIPGVCVSVYNCLSSFLDFQEKDYAPICSFRGKEPIICCTDCNFNDTRNMIISPNLGILHKTGKKAVDKCMENIHRINYPCKGLHNAIMRRFYKPEAECNEVNVTIATLYPAYLGEDARREQFPHMGLLGYGPTSSSADWLCGGTVISEKFILTAGHCLSHPAVGQVKYVGLGVLKRSDPADIWQIYNVKNIYPHPEYKPPSKYHDIALLETDTEIVFSKQVLPACIDTGVKMGKFLYATGWGALGPRKELADTLQRVFIARYTEEECSQLYPPHRLMKSGYNHSTQMCFGDKDGRDTCRGDSGGPLQENEVTFFVQLNCVYTVYGVTSTGRECGIAGGAGLYTRLSYYVPWIESVVWP